MIKAFLSHSSIDKDYVTRVAKLLRRYQIIFDANDFAPGEDFRSEIMNHLGECEVFVLFASQNSLKSGWVKYELNYIEINRIKGRKIEFLVFLLENISYSELPQWMQSMKVISAPGSRMAAEIIQAKIVEHEPIRKKFYVGREEDIQKMNQDMVTTGVEFPRVITIVGLMGIGRKTFIKDYIDKYLSIPYSSIVSVNDSENIDDLYIKLYNENIENLKKQDVEKAINYLKNMDETDKIDEIVRLLLSYKNYNASPIIVDEGGLINNDGQYYQWFNKILVDFCDKQEDAYLVLIERRRPQLNYNDKLSELMYIRKIDTLSMLNTKFLFTRMLNAHNIKDYNDDYIDDICEHLAGYPPAIERAVSFASIYGVEALYNDKTLLLDFKLRTFSHYLKTLNLSSKQLNCMKMLCALGHTTIEIISCALHEPEPNITEIIKSLINLNIITVENSKYKISSPILSSVQHIVGIYDEKEYSVFSKRLKKKYWDDTDEYDVLSIDSLIRFLLLSDLDKELDELKNVIMPSKLLEAAEIDYNERRWGRAEKLCRQLLHLGCKKDKVQIILFKSLIRQENPMKGNGRNDEFLNQLIDQLNKNGNISVNYLKGFKESKRGNYDAAIYHFQNAKKSGDESIQVFRDLADALYWVNRIPEAKEEIRIVCDERNINNGFVLDLAARIAIADKDFKKAEEYIEKQKLVDNLVNVEHRKATLFIAKNEYLEALSCANMACGGQHALVQMYLLRIKINIVLGEYPNAKKDIDYINETFKWYNKDILYILEGRMLLQEEGWKSAEQILRKIKNTESKSAKGLRYKILQQKSIDRTIAVFLRKEAQEEMERLKIHETDILDYYQLFENKRSVDGDEV